MYEYNGRITRVVDGDTVVASIDLGFKVHVTETMRIANVDTQELDDKDGAKAVIGRAARKLAELLANGGPNMMFRTTKLDGVETFGRYVAEVWLYVSTNMGRIQLIQWSDVMKYAGYDKTFVGQMDAETQAVISASYVGDMVKQSQIGVAPEAK
jgi:endonuclease YncB( thermonuclease family)